MIRNRGAARRLRALSLATAAALVAVGVALAPAAPAQQQSGEQEIGLLFAQTANRGTMKPIEGTPRFNLKLRGVNPQVVWFSDRPARQSGHIPVPEFTRSWAGFGFVDDPPNAALTLLRAADHQDTVVVELGRPHFKKKKNRVRYSAQLLDEATGNLSHLESDRDRRVKRRFRAPSLFIDDAAGKIHRNCVIRPYTKCPQGDLRDARLSGDDLTRAELTGADFTGADLTRADLSFADLRGAKLSGANTNLTRAILSSADLRGANLVSAVLVNANLTRANLKRANLSRANARGANLRGADLSGADLIGTDLREANLTLADLTAGADLSGADLTGADIRRADLLGTKFCRTKMPDGSINNTNCR